MIKQHCIICGSQLKDNICVSCQAEHIYFDDQIVRIVEANGTIHTQEDTCAS